MTACKTDKNIPHSGRWINLSLWSVFKIDNTLFNKVAITLIIHKMLIKGAAITISHANFGCHPQTLYSSNMYDWAPGPNFYKCHKSNLITFYITFNNTQIQNALAEVHERHTHASHASLPLLILLENALNTDNMNTTNFFIFFVSKDFSLWLIFWYSKSPVQGARQPTGLCQGQHQALQRVERERLCS